VIESGQLAVRPGRNDYLAYLKENELSEDSVLGILPKFRTPDIPPQSLGKLRI
jgi:hypothetical protein